MIPRNELIARLRNDPIGVDTGQLMEAAANRIEQLEAKLAAVQEPGEWHQAAPASGCNFPLCKSEAEQAKISDQVYRELYSGEPGEPIAYAVMQDGKCIEATTSRACAERWLPYAPRTIEPLYAVPVVKDGLTTAPGERKPKGGERHGIPCKLGQFIQHRKDTANGNEFGLRKQCSIEGCR